eukprot:scaffold3849_cov179-Amphora_coffeaeformis.AAC.30
MKLSFAVLLASVSAISAFAPNNGNQQGRVLTTASKASKVDPMDFVSYYTNDDDSRLPNTLPGGEWNFDPLGFAKIDSLNSFGLNKFFMRESEVKHARLASKSNQTSTLPLHRDDALTHSSLNLFTQCWYAAAGWPVAELLDRPLAKVFGMQPVVDEAGRSPSILNGGLDKINPVFWVSILGAAFVIDMIQINKANADDPEYFPGNLGWDPLGMYPKDEAGQKAMQAKEIRNGRLAMIAITAFAAQEFVTSLGVVEETPAFFKPFFGMF